MPILSLLAAFRYRKVIMAFAPITGLAVPFTFPLAAHAQRSNVAARVRPAFEPKLVKKSTVSGIVPLKVVARRDGLPHEFAPIGSRGWAAVVRIDGHVLASLNRLPAVVNWDTRLAGDGIHEILVTIRNASSDQEVGIEGAQVIVNNAAADTALEAAEISRAAEAGSVSEVGTVATMTLKLPESAKPTTIAAYLSASPDVLAARATALLRDKSRLYLGLPDGGIAFCTLDANPKSASALRSGSVVRLAAPENQVRSLAVGNGRVWWTTQDGRAVYAYNHAAHSVLRYDVTAMLVPFVPDPAPPVPTVPPTPEPPTVETGTQALVPPATAAPPVDTEPLISVPDAPLPSPSKPTGWVRRIAILRGQVVLMGNAGVVRLLNPSSGTLTNAADVEGFLPDDALVGASAKESAHVYMATGGDGTNTLLVSLTPAPLPEPAVKPSEESTTLAAISKISKVNVPRWRRYFLRAWNYSENEKEGSGAWNLVTTFLTDVNPDRTNCLALAPDALATAEREGPHLVRSTVAATTLQASDMPYALSPGMPSSTDQVTLGSSGLWWEQRGIIFHADPRTQARDAFFPWNIPGDSGAVLAMCADTNGVWVATTSGGVRRIQLGAPTARDGYDGYVRARLGAATLVPPTSRDASIANAITAWQGVRYVWGGQSRSGTDCSGFVMRMHQVVGTSIPRTSAEMRRTSQGRRIHDELRWGDTLVYPGHCALYIGDGRTAETVGGSRDGGVSYSSVWVRSNVVVRRFLP